MTYAGGTLQKSHQPCYISNYYISSTSFTTQSWPNAHVAWRTSNGEAGQQLAIMRCMVSLIMRQYSECSWDARPVRQFKTTRAIMKKRCRYSSLDEHWLIYSSCQAHFWLRGSFCPNWGSPNCSVRDLWFMFQLLILLYFSISCIPSSRLGLVEH